MEIFSNYILCCKHSSHSKQTLVTNNNSSNFANSPNNPHTPSLTEKETHLPKNSNTCFDRNNHSTSFKQRIHSSTIKEHNQHQSKQMSVSSNNNNDVSPNLNVSLVTFSNIKVKESYRTLPVFDTEIISSKELRLTGDLFWGKEIMLDRLGVKLNKRRKKDGITYFGVNEGIDSHGNHINDFIINLNKSKGNISNDLVENSSIFSIEYDKLEERFKLNALHNVIPILHLITYDYLIYPNVERSFLIGKIEMDVVCKLMGNNSNSHNNSSSNNNNTTETISVSNLNVNEEWGLCVKVKGDKEMSYQFSKKDTPISIGRTHSSININNNSISKTHAMIGYSNDSNFFFIKDMGSTNGTYLSMRKWDKIPIIKEMKFKLFESKFTIIEVEVGDD